LGGLLALKWAWQNCVGVGVAKFFLLEGRFVGVELAWHIRVRLGGLWALKWGWFVGVKVGNKKLRNLHAIPIA